MRRWLALALVVVLCVPVFVLARPQRSYAIADALVYGYASYLSAVNAAAATYGTKTYSDLIGSGVTDREALGLEALIRSGIGNAQNTSAMIVTPAMAMAAHTYLVSKNLWTGFKASVAGAFAYGSYAWLKLQGTLGSLLGVQGATTVLSSTYPSVTSNLQTLINWTAFKNATIGTGAFRESNGTASTAVGAATVYSWVAAVLSGDVHGSPIPMSVSGSYIWANWGTGSGYIADFNGSSALGQCARAIMPSYQALLDAAAGVTAQTNTIAGTITRPANPSTEPTTGAMPPDPFPGDPWNPTPRGPEFQPVPLWKIANPSGTFGQPPTGGQVASPTSDNQAPYVPPATADKTPIPAVPPVSLGKGAHDAATALQSVTSTDSVFAWLASPIVAILNAIGDALDWLQNCWNTVCAWVGSWVVPSDAGLATAWTQPWADLQSVASTRWPFAIGTVTSSLLTGIQSANGTKTPTLTFSIPLPGGQTLSGDMNTWFQPMDNWRWLGSSLIYFSLIVALVVAFRPRVVT